jgi:purine-nucleoside phosphorylase
MSDPFAALVQDARQQPPEFAVVLGSGLGGITERVRPSTPLPFASIPDLTGARVDGHDGRVVLGDWAGRRVLVFSGRVHAYEGHSPAKVTAAVRLAKMLGANRLILTNAAGGIRDDLVPGTLMAIRAILDMTRVRFWKETTAATASCSERLLAHASRSGELREGVYGAVLGPNYETPAEIRAFRWLGVDAVGMSTAAELEAAVNLGIECLAISCITNRAAGLSDTRLTHEEVLANSRRQAGRLGDLIESLLALRE